MKRFRLIGTTKRIWRARGGVASVEFVLCLPLIALMLFGTIDIGRVLFDYHAVSKSVRDATRYLTHVPASTLGLDMTACTVNQTSAPSLTAKNLALTGTVDGTGAYLLAFWTDPNTITITPSCFDNGGAYGGLYADQTRVVSLTVTATVSFQLLNGWLLDRDNDLTFTIRHEEAHFGD